MTNKELEQRSKESSAISSRSKFYPKLWEHKVPKKIKTLKEVRADMPFSNLKAEFNTEYFCSVNSNGAVSAFLPNGSQIGLKPNEFKVTEWH